MYQTVLLALLPLAGVILGAFLQSTRESKNQKKALKIKAYTDYLQAAATLSSKDQSKHVDARVLLTDAKIRIAIYGSKEVITNIAAFDRMGSFLTNADGMNAFMKITSAMRAEDTKDEIEKADMAQLIFGRDLP